jgi:hypothetical protein
MPHRQGNRAGNPSSAAGHDLHIARGYAYDPVRERDRDLSPAHPHGGASITVWNLASGGQLVNGATLRLSTSQIPSSPPVGAVHPAVCGALVGTSIDPNLAIMPPPNSAECSQSVTMSLANSIMMASANATVGHCNTQRSATIGLLI